MEPLTKAGRYVMGADGYRAGWVCFTFDTQEHTSNVSVVADISSLLSDRPRETAVLAIDIPIGLLDGHRQCDRSARKLLGSPRCSSVFSPPCRDALFEKEYVIASQTNFEKTRRRLTKQAWAIAPKIKQVDDAITPDHQSWVYEIHPEVSFWRLNDCRPMIHKKSRVAGRHERMCLLKRDFPEIERHTNKRPAGVEIDDLLDAAVAAWSGLRIWRGDGECVSAPERDSKGLTVSIFY